MPITFTDGTIPTEVEFNLIRDELLDLKGSGAGQTLTQRDLIMVAPGFIANEILAEIRAILTSGVGTFSFLGDCEDEDLENGQSVSMVFKARERDGGTEKPIGHIKGIRTAAGKGRLELDTWAPDEAGVMAPHDPPALAIEDGKVFILKSTGSSAMNVGGDVLFAVYRQGGSVVGLWTRVGQAMTFVGSMRVSGTLFAGADGGVAFEVISQTLCDNVTAEFLRGYGFPEEILAASNSNAGVPVPAGFGYVEYSPVAQTTTDRDGYYMTRTILSVPIANEANRTGGGLWARVPGTVLIGGLEQNYAIPSLVGEIAILVAIGIKRCVAGEVLKAELANATDGPVVASGSIRARWLATGIDVFGEMVSMPFSFASGGVVTIT